MDLQSFEVFVLAAKRLSVTRAARELHLSQPAASRHLKRVGEEYGIEPFRRNGRGLELTEIGRLFLNDVEVLLAQVAALKRKHGRKLSADLETTLQVGESHGPSASVLHISRRSLKKTSSRSKGGSSHR